jgi:hypothetical protein
MIDQVLSTILAPATTSVNDLAEFGCGARFWEMPPVVVPAAMRHRMNSVLSQAKSTEVGWYAADGGVHQRALAGFALARAECEFGVGPALQLRSPNALVSGTKMTSPLPPSWNRVSNSTCCCRQSLAAVVTF